MAFRAVALTTLLLITLASLLFWATRIQEWMPFNMQKHSIMTQELYNMITRFSSKLNNANGTEHNTEQIDHFSEIDRDRVAVICYIPTDVSQVYHFLTMLFGSWRYIINSQEKLIDRDNVSSIHDVDLLAFCHPTNCPHIETVCKRYETDMNAKENFPGNQVSCWAIEQKFEIDIPYGPINSYVMFKRSDIFTILKPYKYVLRTDFDVFLTPALLTLTTSKQIMTGKGGYCDPFNMKRLKEIAHKLNLTHRGIHCVGSTWYGETNLFIKLAKLTLELTNYMFLKEFEPNATGLETIDFKKNREGEWIRWWRPVSSMYGAELALNHIIKDFSDHYKGELDTPSCSQKLVWESPHIHCWHSDCEFQKFKFMKYLNVAINSKETLPGTIVHRILENLYFHDVKNMTIQDYCTYIAWNSVGKYLRKWFV